MLVGGGIRGLNDNGKKGNKDEIKKKKKKKEGRALGKVNRKSSWPLVQSPGWNSRGQVLEKVGNWVCGENDQPCV